MARRLVGAGASPGVAAGAARLIDPLPRRSARTVADRLRPQEAVRAKRALAAAGSQLTAMAVRLRKEGRSAEAEMVDAGALMATDPMLMEAVTSGTAAGMRAADAINAGCEAVAGQLAAMDDPLFAARAADVRSVGRRAAGLVTGKAAAASSSSGPVVLVASDLGPADVADLGASVRALALAEGGVTAHAAIVARSLGLPLVVGLGPELLQIEEGTDLVVDGERGVVVVHPSTRDLAAARSDQSRRALDACRVAEQATQPVVTVDGLVVRVLANVSSPAEVSIATAAGAEGVGLLRTELAFLEATKWPDRHAHESLLRPILARLEHRPAIIRLLDFGGDKTPAFLAGSGRRGIELLMAEPTALAAQLEALAAVAAGSDVRVLVPMVTEVDHVTLVREALGEAGGSGLPVGAMIETPVAAREAGTLARAADFFSLGTNDLTQAALGLDRGSAASAPAHHPVVLRLIAAAVRAAEQAGIPIEVCGEAASDAITMPLLLGLGIRELSVGAARVGWVRGYVRALRAGRLSEIANLALEASDAAEVEALVAGELGAVVEAGYAVG